MGFENENEVPPEGEITKEALRAAIEAHDAVKAAAIAEAMLKKQPKEFVLLLEQEPLEIVEIALQAVAVHIENAKDKTDLFLRAMHNPDNDIALVAAGKLKEAGLHIGLLKQFQEEKEEKEKRILARVIALTAPQVPRDVALFLMQNPDPVAANAMVEKIGDNINMTMISKEDLTLLEGALRANNMERIMRYHDEKITEHRNTMINNALVESGICRGLDDPMIVAERQNMAGTLKKAGVNAEDFYRNDRGSLEKVIASEKAFAGGNNLPEDKRKKIEAMAESLARSKEEYYDITNQRIMQTLLTFKDKQYYQAYARVLASDLRGAEKFEEQARILFDAVLNEGLSGNGGFTLTLQLTRESVTATEHAISGAVEAFAVQTQSIVEAVTAVAAVSAIANPANDRDPETRKMVEQMSPGMQEAIANADSIQKRGDGSVEVEIEGQHVVFAENGGTLRAHVEAKDGTRFVLPNLSISSLEQTVLFDLTQHDLNRSIWQEKFADKKILEYAFRLNTTDEKLSNPREQRLYEQSLAAMPNMRLSVIKTYQNLGVLGTDMEVDRLRAMRVHSLFRYLDANLGLRYVKRDDIQPIADVWKRAEIRGEKLRLMTPNHARSELKNIA